MVRRAIPDHYPLNSSTEHTASALLKYVHEIHRRKEHTYHAKYTTWRGFVRVQFDCCGGKKNENGTPHVYIPNIGVRKD